MSLYPIAVGFATKKHAGIRFFKHWTCVENVQILQVCKKTENKLRNPEFCGCQFAYLILK
jgi:hypothetical protein